MEWRSTARKLVKSAESDFRAARSYIGNASAASLLYEQAIKKALKALFIRSNRVEPPKNADIRYLAEKSKLPSYIAEELSEIDSAMVPEVEEEAYAALEETQQNTLYKRDTAKRLLDYTASIMRA